MSKGKRPDGLLELTYPAEGTPAIPFFSIIFGYAVCEYVEHTADFSIFDEVGGTVNGIVEIFKKSIDNTGLIKNLPYPYWNFYEWTSGSDGDGEFYKGADERVEKYDLLLNATFVMLVQKLKIFKREYVKDIDENDIKQSIVKTFFNENKKTVFLRSNIMRVIMRFGFAQHIRGVSRLSWGCGNRRKLLSVSAKRVFGGACFKQVFNGIFLRQIRGEVYGYNIHRFRCRIVSAFGTCNKQYSRQSISNEFCRLIHVFLSVRDHYVAYICTRTVRRKIVRKNSGYFRFRKRSRICTRLSANRFVLRFTWFLHPRFLGLCGDNDNSLDSF